MAKYGWKWIDLQFSVNFTEPKWCWNMILKVASLFSFFLTIYQNCNTFLKSISTTPDPNISNSIPGPQKQAWMSMKWQCHRKKVIKMIKSWYVILVPFNKESLWLSLMKDSSKCSFNLRVLPPKDDSWHSSKYSPTKAGFDGWHHCAKMIGYYFTLHWINGNAYHVPHLTYMEGLQEGLAPNLVKL